MNGGSTRDRTPRRPASGAGRRAAARGRPTLTSSHIVDMALALVDRDGLAGLTTRRLGDELGVEAMSIYHHFPSKRHLLDALVDRAIGGIEFPSTGTPGERLRALCYAYRAMAHRHAKLYPLIALHRLNTRAGVAFIERVLELVQAVTRDAEECAREFRVVGYYLTGAALEEISGYARGPSAARPVDDAYVAAHCPRLAAVAPYFKSSEWDATFALGLDALLAQFAARSGAKRGARRARSAASGAIR